MPIKTQSDLPAKEILENENIFVMDENRAMHQEIRPLKICILNLMPLKEETELQLLRALSNTPLQVDVDFMKTSTHVSQNTSANHLNRFYSEFEELEKNKYDGLIITGAPVEQMEYEEVDYWEELCRIMDWSKKNVTSTFHICWGAQAGLYYHFGLQKVQLEEKLFGIFEHKVMNRKIPLVRGFDDYFLAPHSRHTTVPAEAIHACPDLMVLAESEKAGVLLCMTPDGKQIFVMGHLEYDRFTLQKEYERDLKKGLPIHIPVNYFPDDDPAKRPRLQWRAHSNNLYSNWLNYYVYQVTPYVLDEFEDLSAYGMWI
jgi:homoserine O-succinyltransferase